jgi:hypothetical protein
MGEVKEMKIASNHEAKEKMSYEQLENVAHQMSEQSRNLYTQNQQLAKALEESNMTNMFKRLDYLWAVIHSNSMFLTDEFRKRCGEEFMTVMTVPQEEEKSE